MKISVLLPTRDRLELLKLAVESVLRQGYAEFEIVVSDNNSSEPVADYVASLDDPRIVYRRFDRTVPVTENWNNAIAHASGDYIIMLGDDDALCSRYFQRMLEAIELCGQPDCIYTGAYMFTYRGVLPDVDCGIVYENCNSVFFRGVTEPWLLERDRRLQLVNDSMALYSSYGFNMQYVTVRRDLVQQLTDDEGFYKSQYPDYYAMNNILLKARRFLVVEEPLVAIGTSSSSFGWYYHNRLETSGNRVLNIESGMEQEAANIGLKPLAGTSMNTNWLTSMMKLYRDNHSFPGLAAPNIARYRYKQIIYFCLIQADGKLSASEKAAFRQQLSPLETCKYLILRPLAGMGSPGRRLLAFLHIASQKRTGYMIRALFKRLGGQAPIVRFTQDRNILDSEELIRGRA